MKVLVDTCVLSEAMHPKGNPRVRAALESIADADIYLSVITLGELANGIARLDPGRKRDELHTWLNAIQHLHAERILGIDLECSLVWGDLTAKASAAGETIPAADGLIAASAVQHGLAIMTRNRKRFQAVSVRLIDPWEIEGRV